MAVVIKCEQTVTVTLADGRIARGVSVYGELLRDTVLGSGVSGVSEVSEM